MFGHVSQAYLFPLLVSFIGTILLTSSVYTTLKLIKNPDTELSVKNSLTLFKEEYFSQTFLTLLLKRLYLFLWSIPSLLGIYFLFYSSFLAKKFVAIHPEFPNLDLTSVETERFLMTFGLYFLASILLMIVGNSLYIPQYYAYSQVEFLLCDTLDLGQAKQDKSLKPAVSWWKVTSSSVSSWTYNSFLGTSSIGLLLGLLVSHSYPIFKSIKWFFTEQYWLENVGIDKNLIKPAP